MKKVEFKYYYENRGACSLIGFKSFDNGESYAQRVAEINRLFKEKISNVQMVLGHCGKIVEEEI